MNKKVILPVVGLSLIGATVSAVAINAGLSKAFGVFSDGPIEPTEYNLTITQLDIDRGYAITTSGNRISFVKVGVSSSGDQIVFSEKGYLRFTDPINGTKSVVVSGLDGNEAIKLSSGYEDDVYGKTDGLDSENHSLNLHYRTHFKFLNDGNDTVYVDSILLTYTCERHYQFSPVLENETTEGKSGDVLNFNGLSYLDDIVPEDGVRVEEELFSFTVPTENPDPIYDFHPTVKYYDAGDCLIRQESANWVIHLNPLVRFHVSRTETIDKVCEYGVAFDKTLVTKGRLSAYDWTEFTKAGGALDGIVATNLDLYPKVTINVNPGAGSDTASYSTDFTPNPNNDNFGFPVIAEPEINDGYKFRGWYEGDDLYDPASVTEFDDIDLYARYNSEFDLRLKFVNRGFDTPYFEVGIPDGDSYLLSSATAQFVDQTTTGLGLGYKVESDGSANQGYWIYPSGDRSAGQFYSVSATFVNNGKGTNEKPADYIAEPYTDYTPETVFTLAEGNGYERGGGLWGTDIAGYKEYGYGQRSFFKIAAIPDSLMLNKKRQTILSTSDRNTEVPTLIEPSASKGIVNSGKIEKIVGNDHFYEVGRFGFSNNASLKELEYFPALRKINHYAFYNCPNLLPMNQWEGIGAIEYIGAHAFEGCYSSPLRDAQDNIARRSIVIPSSVTYIGETAFSACCTDFDFYPSPNFDAGSLSLRPFGLRQTNPVVHSDAFQEVLNQYQAASEEDKPALIAKLKERANHVIFHGSQSTYESLWGNNYSYDSATELSTLLEDEYYVTFTE